MRKHGINHQPGCLKRCTRTPLACRCSLVELVEVRGVAEMDVTGAVRCFPCSAHTATRPNGRDMLTARWVVDHHKGRSTDMQATTAGVSANPALP